MQKFDPGLTDLIKEVDSLVSTPARRPTQSDWNWLDQQMASRQTARCRNVSAAADAHSEVSFHPPPLPPGGHRISFLASVEDFSQFIMPCSLV